MTAPPPPAVVLAAGGSTRMGRPKALVGIGGRPALARVVEACREGGCGEVLVVVGSDAEAVGAAARAAGAAVVENGAWARGRSTSVKAALPHLPRGAAAMLLFPVDHPLAGAEVVRALLAAPPAEVVVPVHGGRRGHPVLLSARLFPEIAALGDDEPLRAVVHRAGRTVIEVPVEGDGVLRNIDRPEDLPPG
ncbi:MAG: nucleotidyltransferase family protein [Planctomycetes bacterium]|nr:nucleotidyltransferase family protein [Planctomycetota bacterium]